MSGIFREFSDRQTGSENGVVFVGVGEDVGGSILSSSVARALEVTQHAF